MQNLSDLVYVTSNPSRTNERMNKGVTAAKSAGPVKGLFETGRHGGRGHSAFPRFIAVGFLAHMTSPLEGVRWPCTWQLLHQIKCLRKEFAVCPAVRKPTS